MASIIPRKLIKHLEWTPNSSNPTQATSSPAAASAVTNAPSQLSETFAKYIQVGIPGLHGGPAVISPFELEGYNDKRYNDTHLKLLNNGIYMPSHDIFSTHVKNVIAAQKGERTLVYADGTEVPRSVIEDMYKHFTKDHKDIYGTGIAGAWTWLNARFVRGEGANNLALETVIGLKDPRTVEVRQIPLSDYLTDEGFTNFEFNEQGLPKPGSRSSRQSYKAGENFYFYPPAKDMVAWFGAGSYWAGLDCSRDPSVRGASLGVFGCAEGAVPKSFGGKA